MSSSSQTNVPPRGGMGSESTPANNVGGGDASGGASGLFKQLFGQSKAPQDAEQRDSTTTANAKISNADFSSLRDQKEGAEAQYYARQSNAEQRELPLSQEDRSFQYQKPGQENDTLPGWQKVKGISKSLAGN